MGGTSLSTPLTCPPSRTGSGSCPRAAGSGSGSATRTPPGATARPSLPARAAASTGTSSTLAVCTRTGLPLAWRVETARRHESLYVAPLLDAARARGFKPETCAMDKGYDNNRVMDETRERGCVPSSRFARAARSRSARSPTAPTSGSASTVAAPAVEREFCRLEERVRTDAAPRAWAWTGRASRRPHDARSPRPRPQSGTNGHARRLTGTLDT